VTEQAAGRAAERATLTAYREAVEAGRPPSAEVVGRIDALFAANQGRVYAVCRRMTGNEELARDLAQDTLLTAYRKLATFRGDSAFGTWLYGIAKMLCLNAIRRRRDVLSEDGLFEPGDPTPSVLSRMRKAEREELVRQASLTLSPLEQEAVYLRYVEDIPQDRITVLLAITQSSGARGVLQTCRRTLRRELHRLLAEMGHGTSFIRPSIA
jgi:RNA polymerase sigma-70 factor (ECF subfamily)